jgi:ACS family hexuronate transporter-like MFS transporter
MSIVNARRATFTWARSDDQRRVRRPGAEPVRGDPALQRGRVRHQTLSVTVITMASDLFRRSEVATVAGMAGRSAMPGC